MHRDVGGRALGAALATSAAVAAPLAIATALGETGTGAAMTLGAYLATVSHLTTPRPLGPRVMAVTIVSLAVAGGVGFAAGGLWWLLVVACGVWAVPQAVGEIAGGPLRMTAAMSALCVLLSSIGGRPSITEASAYAGLVAAGASWAMVVDVARHGPSRGTGTPSPDLPRLVRAWPSARTYGASLAGVTMLAAASAGLVQISHGAWMAAAALRVLRPESEATVPRAGRRVLGTAAGALVAAALLAVPAREPVAVLVVVVAVAAMQVIGPRRYGWFSFFLTLVALALNSAGEASDLRLAGIRVLLTVAGVALAVVAALAVDAVRRRGRPRQG